MDISSLKIWLLNPENYQNWIFPIAGSLIIPLLLFLWTRKTRSFSYSIIESSIHSTEKNEDGSTFYIEKIAIKYLNQGNVELKEEDFPIGVTTRFLKAAKVNSAFVRDTLDVTQRPLIIFKPSTTGGLLQPQLFNAGDYCIVDYYVENYEQAVHVGGKVKGVSTIRNSTAFSTMWNNVILFMLCGLSITILRSIGLNFPLTLFLSLLLIFWLGHSIIRLMRSQGGFYMAWDVPM